jgi:hypothetical protein
MFMSIGGEVVPKEIIGEGRISNPSLPESNENELTALAAQSKIKSELKRGAAVVAVAVGEVVVVSMMGERSTSEKRLPRTSEVSIVRGDVCVLVRVDWLDMLAAAAATSCIASSLVSKSFELAEEGEVRVVVMGVEKVEIGLGKAISSKRTKSSKAFSA